MGKKGEDVKHLFAHLGLDPGSYRDLKSGESGDKPKAGRADDKAAKPARRKPAAAKAAPSEADMPEAEVPPRMAAVSPDEAETAAAGDEPMPAEQSTAEQIAAEPDRWSLLAMLGEGNLPVADLPEPEAVANMAFGARNGTVSDAGVEADTPRLRRAGSLSALLRGAGEAAAVDDAPEPPSARVETHVVDEDPADDPHETVDETDEAATVEDTEVAEPEPAESAVMEPDDTREEPPPARRRTSTGAIGKLMDRLRETPIERHIEPARLKLNYERREKAVVAEKPVDQDIATVFGRLKRSRVD